MRFNRKLVTFEKKNRINKKMQGFFVFVVACVPYWNDPRIHNIGNGKMQAWIAPFATKLIDLVSYNNVNVRERVLAEHIHERDTVCDFCCGVGFSTAQVGVDTSQAMIDKARKQYINKQFVLDNVETYGDTDQYDVVTIMFALHEMPSNARTKVLENAVRVARRKVIVCDISSLKTPSRLMLSGEPYLLNYQAQINFDICNLAWNHPKVQLMQYDENYIKNHVMVATLVL